MFRCFFMGSDGHFVGAIHVETPEEDTAIEEAREGVAKRRRPASDRI